MQALAPRRLNARPTESEQHSFQSTIPNTCYIATKFAKKAFILNLNNGKYDFATRRK
jgi:hypothetical protein